MSCTEMAKLAAPTCNGIALIEHHERAFLYAICAKYVYKLGICFAITWHEVNSRPFKCQRS